MTIIVALPTDEGIVLVTDTRVTHYRAGTHTDGTRKIRRIGTHCVFATTGSPEYSDTSGRTVADLSDVVEECLDDFRKASDCPILINPTAISQQLAYRVGQRLNDVNADFNECTFFLVYEFTESYGLLAHSFETELKIGEFVNVWEKPIQLNTRPFWDRVRGQHEKALANGIGPYSALRQNALFNRVMEGETLSTDDSFELAYEFVKAASSVPNSKVSPTIEAILLDENGVTVRQSLGTDVNLL